MRNTAEAYAGMREILGLGGPATRFLTPQRRAPRWPSARKRPTGGGSIPPGRRATDPLIEEGSNRGSGCAPHPRRCLVGSTLLGEATDRAFAEVDGGRVTGTYKVEVIDLVLADTGASCLDSAIPVYPATRRSKLGGLRHCRLAPPHAACARRANPPCRPAECRQRTPGARSGGTGAR